MQDRLRKLAFHLLDIGLMEESSLCSSIVVRLGKEGNSRTEPYGSMSDPMTPLAWAEEECTHEFDADQCPVCGKMLRD